MFWQQIPIDTFRAIPVEFVPDKITKHLATSIWKINGIR